MSERFGYGGLRPNCGNQNANLGRKRPRIHSDRTVPADHAEASGLVKLYVAQVPRTGAEEAIHPLFEVHGDIVEINWSTERSMISSSGSCFVNYATSVEADRAISALDNQYTFPGELTPMNVKYADSERDRLGYSLCKASIVVYFVLAFYVLSIARPRGNNISGRVRFGHPPQPFRSEPPLGPPAGG
ncbi:Flowering time control protein FCA, partial [Cucurbita argyrosperma subsp. sororia]